MKTRLYPIALPILLALAACRPGAAEFTTAEAPNTLKLDSAATRLDVRFLADRDRLAPGEVARLRYLAASGAIRASDRVTVSPGGWPSLARRRADAIQRTLLPYGIVPRMVQLAAVPRDDALIEVGRYLVTLPRCPNWSKPASGDFSNTGDSNYGCATESDLGLQVADPADLAGGQTLGPVDGMPAAAAVNRYMADKIALPAENSNLPIAGASAPAAGAGAGASGGS